MCSEGYLEYLLHVNDTIYMDTSTLMNVESLKKFLVAGERLFRQYNKRITVPYFVIKELDKHLKDSEKQSTAHEVLKLIFQFSDLFYIEQDEDSRESFADAAFLSRLTRDKSRFGQLFISADKNLREDAVKLNKQYSCKGKTIMVCHINKCGDITREKSSKARVSAPHTRILSNPAFNEEIQKPKQDESIVYMNTLKEMNSPYPKWKTPTIFIGGVVGGIVIDQVVTRYIKPLLLSA